MPLMSAYVFRFFGIIFFPLRSGYHVRNGDDENEIADTYYIAGICFDPFEHDSLL